MLNKIKLNLLTILSAIGIVIVISVGVYIMGEKLNEKELKSFKVKSVDSESIECYINCNEEYKIITVDVDLAVKQARERENERIAEVKRLAEEAEKARLAELARIEAEKKRKAELEKERIRRLEEKKKQVATISRGSNSASEWIQFEATYYSAFCNTGCTGITKLGWDVRNTIYHEGHRVIAVDPNIIPLGSLVQVKTPHETFYALAGDTGGSIKRYRIDILVDSTKTAYKLGRHPVQVRMIKKDK